MTSLSPFAPPRSCGTLSSDAPRGVRALFFESSLAIFAATAAVSSGASGISRSVWHESTSRPSTRSANGVPAGMVFELSFESVCLARSMRRCDPMRWSMLPEASRMISTVPKTGGAVTDTRPASVFAAVILIGARARVACDWPVE